MNVEMRSRRSEDLTGARISPSDSEHGNDDSDGSDDDDGNEKSGSELAIHHIVIYS